MASTTNKPFHTYENVGYEDQVNHNHYAPPTSNATLANTMATNNNNGISGIAINKTAIESPFPDPIDGKLAGRFN